MASIVYLYKDRNNNGQWIIQTKPWLKVLGLHKKQPTHTWATPGGSNKNTMQISSDNQATVNTEAIHNVYKSRNNWFHVESKFATERKNAA